MDFRFDFDDASECWKQNKKSVGNGMYVYICEAVCKNGKKCNKKVCYKKNGKSNVLSTHCNLHFNKNHFD
jgi:hypothetical protein